MSRPRIDIEKDGSDWVIEIVGFLFLAGLIIMPLYYYDQLPESIATHYNANGKADGFSGRGMIWSLPATGLVMFIGLSVINKFPHIFNYPTEITIDNAERQYRGATKLIRMLNTIIMGAFLYISSRTILGALNKDAGLGAWFIPVFIILMFTPIVYYLVYSVNNKSKK
ncbi:MAG: hypothetical protein CMP48_27200 [Rickettsiales bacterium]|nr:hypothetical protein [Rickettsiales bacterium]